MNINIIILIAAWLTTIVLLIVFIPKDKIRHAILVFFFKQFITWILGLIVVETKLIRYPIRSFPYATRSSFDFEYFVYPAFCAIFNLHYPKSKNAITQFMYYFYYCTGLTLVELVLEKNTNLIVYTNWKWYFSWISFYTTFYISRKFYLWFFRLKKDY